MRCTLSRLALSFTLTAACATFNATSRTTAPQRETSIEWGDPARVEKLTAAAAALAPALDERLTDAKVPGAAVGIVADGKLVWFHSVGVREVPGRAPIDQDTVFRIASMSKAFVSASVLRLRDEGKLSLDEPAEKYLPELRGLVYPTVDSPKLTVRHLLSHSAGLPEDNASADLRMPMLDADFDKLLARGLSFSTAPGTQFEYSNLGFALAGRLVTRVSGMRLQEYVTRNLLGPLGMTSTRWEAGSVPEDHKAHGYGRKGSAMPSSGLSRYEDDTFHEEPVLADGAWAPIGGLWTSSRDYARWVGFQLAAWPPRDDTDSGPMRRASLRETQEIQRARPVFAERDEHGDLDAIARGYGLGWGVRSTCDFESVVSHTGGLPGYGSYVLLLPAQGVGVFSMTNLTYTSGAAAVLELVKGLRARGVLPERPVAISPQLERVRASVLELLSSWDEERAAALFDVHYAAYRTPEKQRAELETLHKAHGSCRPTADAEPENALRGRLRLSCDRGAIALSVELTSDVPPRIQALLLESVLPPSAALQQAATRAAGLLMQWDDAAAAQLLAPQADGKKVRQTFARATANHGACRLQQPLRSDGDTSAAFRLGCEHGDLDLELKLATGGRASEVDVVPVHGGPRCPR